MGDRNFIWKATFPSLSLFAPSVHMETKLLNVFKEDNVEQIKEMVTDIPELLKREDFMGCTILFEAVKHGSINILRHLLSLDESFINVQDAQGETLLLHALFNQNRNSNVTFDIVCYLLEQNCDVSISNKWGYTPLHVAAIRGNVKVCSVLIEKGADVNAKSQDGYTPLLAAIHSRDMETVCALLYYNASVNEVWEYTYVTPFCVAVLDSDIQIAKLLIDYVEFSDGYFVPSKRLIMDIHRLLPILPEILDKAVDCRSSFLDHVRDTVLWWSHSFNDDPLELIWGGLSCGATASTDVIASLYYEKGFCKEIEAIFSSEVPIKRGLYSHSITSQLVYNEAIEFLEYSSLEKKFYAPVYDEFVPSLMQLARDKCRKIIFDKHQRGANFKAYNVIMGLDIPKRLKDILVLKQPIYEDIDTNSTYEDNDMMDYSS